MDCLGDHHHEDVDKGPFLEMCYNFALHICCLSQDKEAVKIARQLWQQMDTRPASTSLEAFKLLLQVHDEHDSHPSEIEKLVISKEERYDIGKCDWYPDSDAYNMVIRKWSQLREPHAVKNSFNLLTRMDQNAKEKGPDNCATPDFVSYANVLWACAVTPTTGVKEKLENFAVAIEVFNHLRDSEYCEPDSVIYNRLLMCGIVLGRGTKFYSKIIIQVFQLCCRDGFVDERILQHFCTAAPPHYSNEDFWYDRKKVCNIVANSRRMEKPCRI
mmetsp:Transcript_27396/g.38568  ORF Transcript_27396/g.38568 Transcript_27396/m.38568 type:complete len:272 (-) Transcript_27396:311-1126(-)